MARSAPLTLLLASGLLVACLVLLPSAVTAQIDRSVGADGVIEIKSQKGKKSGSSSSRATNSRKNKPLGPAVVMPSDQSKERVSRYDPFIQEAATLYHLPPAYIRAIMQTESNFDPRAVSPAGAMGLMQLMPFTAERMMVTDIMDPRQNIMGGARYLRILANLFNGDIHLATAAYNAGENAVIRYGGIPPYEETQNYVVKVLSSYQRYRAQEAGSL